MFEFLANHTDLFLVIVFIVASVGAIVEAIYKD